MESGVYTTDDLALSVCLALEGFTYKLENLTETSVIWHFDIPTEKDEQFDRIVNDFDSWEHKVEPRRFSARWADMRREMFARIPARPPHPGRRAAPAT